MKSMSEYEILEVFENQTISEDNFITILQYHTGVTKNDICKILAILKKLDRLNVKY